MTKLPRATLAGVKLTQHGLSMDALVVLTEVAAELHGRGDVVGAQWGMETGNTRSFTMTFVTERGARDFLRQALRENGVPYPATGHMLEHAESADHHGYGEMLDDCMTCFDLWNDRRRAGTGGSK